MRFASPPPPSSIDWANTVPSVPRLPVNCTGRFAPPPERLESVWAALTSPAQLAQWFAPGEIELTLRNDGPDAVSIEQVSIADGYVGFTTDDAELGRLDSATLDIAYPWIEGEAYNVVLLTSTGGTIGRPSVHPCA